MKKVILPSLVFSLLLFGDCNKESLQVGQTTIAPAKTTQSASDIPYADEETLRSIGGNKGYVPYKTARTMALLDLETNIKESMQWHGAKLSEKPVVIYDGKSRAKHYEFIVSDGSGKPVGTLTACARKEAGTALSHVLPYVRDYSYFTTKGSNYKMISGGYPGRILLGIVGKDGDNPAGTMDPITGETVKDVPTEGADGMVNFVSQMNAEQQKEYGITDKASTIEGIKKKEEENKEEAKEFWKQADTLQAALEKISDDEIAEKINANKGFDSWWSVEHFVIPAYNNVRGIWWQGWCGPSEIAWIYRGIWDRYNGQPLGQIMYDFDDGRDDDGDGRRNDLDPDWVRATSLSTDGGLYANIAAMSGLYALPFGTNNLLQYGPTLPSFLRASLMSVTASQYTLTGAIWSPHDYIQASQPVLSTAEWATHWVTYFGSYSLTWNFSWWYRIFWRRVTIASGRVRIMKWLLLHDNSYLTRGNPYWKSDLFDFNLKYAVVRR